MPIALHPQGITVNIRLTPNARMNGVVGVMDIAGARHALKVSVTAVPEDGKANKALIALLAKEWGVAKSALSLLSGDTNRQKVILLTGDSSALFAQLAPRFERLIKKITFVTL